MRRKCSAAVKIVMAMMLILALAIPSATAEVYHMAMSLAITGPTSDAGNPYSKGVEDYIRYVNDTKMLGADRVECPIRDDQYKTDVTKRNFEEFLDMGIVFYLNYSTGSTLALKRDFEEEKIPVIPASMHAGQPDQIPTIFFCPSPAIPASVSVWQSTLPKRIRAATPKVGHVYPSVSLWAAARWKM